MHYLPALATYWGPVPPDLPYVILLIFSCKFQTQCHLLSAWALPGRVRGVCTYMVLVPQIAEPLIIPTPDRGLEISECRFRSYCR